MLQVLYDKALVVAKYKRDNAVSLKHVLAFTGTTAIKDVAAYAVSSADSDYRCAFEITNKGGIYMFAAKVTHITVGMCVVVQLMLCSCCHVCYYTYRGGLSL